MASHPYISGPGSVAKMIGFLRKNFPATVNSGTVKKFQIAKSNESYLINALQFIGVIDKDGKRTELGRDVLSTHDEGEFQRAFGSLIRDSYKELFELRGDDAWTIDKDALIGYFRNADKTSEVIGTRQADLFQTFRVLAGHTQASVAKKNGKTFNPSTNPAGQNKKHAKNSANAPVPVEASAAVTTSKNAMALSVRVEINLPTDATAETYDNIFKSIRANLLDE